MHHFLTMTITMVSPLSSPVAVDATAIAAANEAPDRSISPNPPSPSRRVALFRDSPSPSRRSKRDRKRPVCLPAQKKRSGTDEAAENDHAADSTATATHCPPLLRHHLTVALTLSLFDAIAAVNDAPVTSFSLPSLLPMLLHRYFALFSANISNDSMTS